MRVPPPAVWATYPEPNYVDPVTRGPTLLIVNVILLSMVTIAVVGRLYSRLFIKRWFGCDDIMIIPAFMFDVGLTAVVLLANLRYGWDRHIYDLPDNWIPPAQKIAFAAKIMFTLAATAVRLSMICFYYRLMKQSGTRWYFWVLHLSVLWNIALAVTFIVLTIWLCSPIQAYWSFPPTGHCISEGKAMLGGGVVNSATDLWTTILPIPIVMRLKMPLRQRVGVCVLLSMGVVATAAGAVRTYYSWKSLLHDWDETWWAYWLWVAAAIEIHLGMICACAPAWKAILQDPWQTLTSKISSKLSSLRSHSNSPTSSSTAKPAIFSPLRSLPWFQITRLDFEKTRQDPTEAEMDDGDGKLGDSPSSSSGQAPRRAEDTESRLSGTTANSSKPAEAAMCIAMRHSIDQSSTHMQCDQVTPASQMTERGQPRISSG